MLNDKSCEQIESQINYNDMNISKEKIFIDLDNSQINKH
jgi:hypothetical protein